EAHSPICLSNPIGDLRLAEFLVDELRDAPDHVSFGQDRLYDDCVVIENPVPVGGEGTLVVWITGRERGHEIGRRVPLLLKENREIRFRDVSQEDLGSPRNLLLHANLPDPCPDGPGPIVLLLAGDAIAARLPPRQRLPGHSSRVPARPECDRPLAFSPGSLLDEPNHPGADPLALQFPRNIDVDKFQRLAAILDRHAADDAAVELGHPNRLFADEVRILPRRGQPLDVTEDQLGPWCSEPDVRLLVYRRVRYRHDHGDILPAGGTEANSGTDARHRPVISGFSFPLCVLSSVRCALSGSRISGGCPRLRPPRKSSRAHPAFRLLFASRIDKLDRRRDRNRDRRLASACYAEEVRPRVQRSIGCDPAEISIHRSAGRLSSTRFEVVRAEAP